MSKSFISDQFSFTQYIRDPKNASLPDGVEKRRMTLYADLIFNNIENVIAKSFPVLQKTTDEVTWDLLLRSFLKNHYSKTPYFSKIPLEFINFLEKSDIKLSDFALELAHYEWVEISLTQDLREPSFENIDQNANLLKSIPVVNPLTELLIYRWPVHKIDTKFIPEEVPTELTYLVVYRDISYKVGFIELNQTSAKLLQELKTNIKRNTQEILLNIAKELKHPEPNVVVNGGIEIMQDFKNKNIILGVRK